MRTQIPITLMVYSNPTGGTHPQPPSPGKIKSHLSAETFLTRAFDLNQTHLDPTITEVLIFEEPGEQLTFSQNRL